MNGRSVVWSDVKFIWHELNENQVGKCCFVHIYSLCCFCKKNQIHTHTHTQMMQTKKFHITKSQYTALFPFRVKRAGCSEANSIHVFVSRISWKSKHVRGAFRRRLLLKDLFFSIGQSEKESQRDSERNWKFTYLCYIFVWTTTAWMILFAFFRNVTVSNAFVGNIQSYNIYSFILFCFCCSVFLHQFPFLSKAILFSRAGKCYIFKQPNTICICVIF